MKLLFAAFAIVASILSACGGGTDAVSVSVVDDFTNDRSNTDGKGYGSFSTVVSVTVKSGSGSIETAGDIDYFTYTNSTPSVDLFKFTTTSPVSIAVYDGTGSLLTANVQGEYTFQASTTYYIQITGVGPTTYNIDATWMQI